MGNWGEAEEHASVIRCWGTSLLGTSWQWHYQIETHGVGGRYLSSDVMVEAAREEEAAEGHASVIYCRGSSPPGTSWQRQYEIETHGVGGRCLSSDVMTEAAKEEGVDEEVAGGHASVIRY